MTDDQMREEIEYCHKEQVLQVRLSGKEYVELLESLGAERARSAKLIKALRLIVPTEILSCTEEAAAQIARDAITEYEESK